jgi:hypothetical protein
MLNAGTLTFKEFAMREQLPLATIHDVVLEFLRGRDDAVVFGAQAVNVLGIKNLKDTMDKICNAFGLIDGGIDWETEGRALDAELEAEMRSHLSWE